MYMSVPLEVAYIHVLQRMDPDQICTKLFSLIRVQNLIESRLSFSLRCVCVLVFASMILSYS